MNEYNSFNKYKGFMHKEHFDGIVSGNFLPPYCVCTDPSNDCIHNCIYCNAKEYRKETNNCYMPHGHLLTLADFYKDWGIKATIIEGGGEPLLNKEVVPFIQRLNRYDIEVGLITNGYLIDTDVADCLIDNARFVGISFDAACKETYIKMRGADHFKAVAHNIDYLNQVKDEKGSKLDVNMKFLIHEYNYTEIYEFTRLCKDLGCNGAHIKPVAFDNLDVEKFDLSIHKEAINEQIEKAKELEDDSFSVYAIMYKFGDNLETKLKFSKCETTPIGGVFGADGNFYLCFNMRGKPGFKLSPHHPDPYAIKRVWGSTSHKELISNIDTTKCMRCGLTAYNEAIEQCIRQDKLFRNFL